MEQCLGLTFQIEELLRVRVQRLNVSEFEGRVSCGLSGKEDSPTIEQEERAEGTSVKEREKKRGEKGRKERKGQKETEESEDFEDCQLSFGLIHETQLLNDF